MNFGCNLLAAEIDTSLQYIRIHLLLHSSIHRSPGCAIRYSCRQPFSVSSSRLHVSQSKTWRTGAERSSINLGMDFAQQKGLQNEKELWWVEKGLREANGKVVCFGSEHVGSNRNSLSPWHLDEQITLY